jgi:hypothetical protein
MLLLAGVAPTRARASHFERLPHFKTKLLHFLSHG